MTPTKRLEQSSDAPRWPAEDHPRFAARVLAAGAVGLLFSPASLLFYSGGVFVLPIAADTGWSKGTIASAIGSTALVLGLMSPVIGYLVDRFKPRRVAMAAMPSLGLGMILLGLVPRTASAFFAMMILAAVLAAGQLPHGYTLSVASWFDRRRGLALGTILSFTGMGLALVAPLAATLIGVVGWRLTYVIMGSAVAVIGLSAAAILVADPPDCRRTSESQSGLTCREAITTKRFWFIAIAFLLVAASVGAGTVHLPIILGERGISPATAATALSAVGAATIVMRFVYGYLLDRIFAPVLAAGIFVVLACAHLALLAGSSFMALCGAVMLGVALGAEVDALSYVVAQAFGLRNFGRIFGLMFMAVGFGGGLGPGLMARIAARSGNYTIALECAAVAAMVAAMLITMVRRRDLPFTGH